MDAFGNRSTTVDYSNLLTWETTTSMPELISVRRPTDPCQFQNKPESFAIIILFFIIFCLSVVGNSVVLVIITQQRWMRTVTNLYLLNLAISDLLLSVICMPTTLPAVILHCYIFPTSICPLLLYLQPVSVTASAYTLVLIAVERYFAICRPLHSRHWQTKQHAARMIVLVWIASLIVNTPIIFMTEALEIRTGQFNCRYKQWVGPEAISGHMGYMLIFLFLIPGLIMLVLYSSVVKNLRSGMQAEKEALSCNVNGFANDDDDDIDTMNNRGFINKVQRKLTARLKPSKEQQESLAVELKPPSGDTRENLLTTKKNQNLSPATHVQSFSLRSTHAERSLQAKKRVVIMLMAVVFEFFIFWTPLFTINLLSALNVAFHLGFDGLYKFHVYTLMLAYCSTCCNPITYCFLNEKFRHAFLYAFGCGTYVDRLRIRRADERRTTLAASSKQQPSRMSKSSHETSPLRFLTNEQGKHSRQATTCERLSVVCESQEVADKENSPALKPANVRHDTSKLSPGQIV